MNLLFVGGLDPLGRAGLLVDRRIAEGLGCSSVTVCSAVTAQDDHRAMAEPVSIDLFTEQLAVAFASSPSTVVKTGWLASAEQVDALLAVLPSALPLVVDPLLGTSSGLRVYGDDPRGPAYRRLMARADLLTPNLPEAEALLGRPVDDPAEAASAIRLLGARAVLIKGGHGSGDQLTDLLLHGDGDVLLLRHERLPGRHRGTGCRLAAGVAARLARGQELEDALRGSTDFLLAELASAAGLERS